MTTEFTSESTMTFPELAPGVKHDDGKILAGILLEFAPALLKVAEVGTFGARKYSRENWKKVPDRETRYLDAAWRHLLQHGVDPESGLQHLHHAIWNLLAVATIKDEDMP